MSIAAVPDRASLTGLDGSWADLCHLQTAGASASLQEVLTGAIIATGPMLCESLVNNSLPSLVTQISWVYPLVHTLPPVSLSQPGGDGSYRRPVVLHCSLLYILSTEKCGACTTMETHKNHNLSS